MSRALIVVAVLLAVTSSVSGCAEEEAASAKRAEAPSASSVPTPETPGPGGQVTDFNGPPNVGASFTVPAGVTEFPDGSGKRAYRLTKGDGAILIGELEQLYALQRNGILRARQVGNDVAAALAVIQDRRDYEVLAQGTVSVAGKDVPLVAISLAKGAYPSDLWCFTHDSSCYKNPEGLTTQAILVPWRDSMLWMNVEWEGGGSLPQPLQRARDELLGSLEFEG